MDGSGGGNSVVASKNVLMSIAAAAGVGCLALYAWNRWWQCDEEAADESASHDDRYKYTQLQPAPDGMGQSQTAHYGSPIDSGDPAYSPVAGRRVGADDWSITVNPREENEKQQLIQSSTSQTTVEGGADGGKAQKDRRKFKRVIFRSRMEDSDYTNLPQSPNGNAPNAENRLSTATGGVVTSQPKSVSAPGAGPIVLTNLRLADKLRGFSNEEYQNTLQGTLNRLYGSTKILTVDEAKCLTLLLQQKSSDTLLKTLTTTSNLAAFTINQDLLREQGAIELLVDLLHDESISDSAQVMLVQCIGNMAVNQTNNKLLQCCVPRIIQHLLSPDSSELQRVMCVQALTNLSVDASVNKAGVYAPILPVVYQRLWTHTGVNIATLRLLVNLSCTANMIPYMLATETNVDLTQLISDENTSADVLVRATTFLFYVASTVDTLGLDEGEIRSKAANFEKSVYCKLFCGDGLSRFREAVERLRSHENEEVRERTGRISHHLASIERSWKAAGESRTDCE